MGDEEENNNYGIFLSSWSINIDRMLCLFSLIVDTFFWIMKSNNTLFAGSTSLLYNVL